MPKRFLVVDDDRSNNLICKCSLRRFCSETEINTFLQPEVALQYIRDSYAAIDTNIPTIIFLDINMPILSGWDFLEIFQDFSSQTKQQFSIFMLTSSIDERDREKAALNPLVKGFLSKPLSTQAVSEIIQKI